MSNDDYEQAANDMRVWMEDNRKSKIESKDDLESILATVLANRRIARGVRSSLAWETAWDDAASMRYNLDTLRPVLEAWWKDR